MYKWAPHKFSSCERPRPGGGGGGAWCVYPHGVKQLGLEVDHYPPSSTDINEWIYTFALPECLLQNYWESQVSTWDVALTKKNACFIACTDPSSSFICQLQSSDRNENLPSNLTSATVNQYLFVLPLLQALPAKQSEIRQSSGSTG
jgi:hypothetical protein